MAQYTVNLDPVYGTQAELRLCRGRKDAVTLTIRTGETIVTDDPELIAVLEGIAARSAARVLSVRATRPASPTHNIDSMPREPAPTAGRAR